MAKWAEEKEVNMTTINTSTDAINRLACDHITAGNDPDFMGLLAHWKTAATLLALLKERDEARDALNKVRAEAMRALRPFAEYIANGGDRNYKGEPLPDTEGIGRSYLPIGDFRRAALATIDAYMTEAVESVNEIVANIEHNFDR